MEALGCKDLAIDEASFAKSVWDLGFCASLGGYKTLHPRNADGTLASNKNLHRRKASLLLCSACWLRV